MIANLISTGDEILEDEKSKIEKEVEIYHIRQSSFRYLSGRSHSRFELKTKLLKKNYNKDIIETVLNDLNKSGFINDEQFAADYLRSRLAKKNGPLKIKAELIKKGVGREAIDSAFDGEYDEKNAVETGREIAQKKYSILKNRGIEIKKIKQKLFVYLSGKGYPPNIVNQIMNNMEFNDEE